MSTSTAATEADGADLPSRESALRIIELDATRWRAALDLYDDLLPALGSPEWHGRNLNALIDSMIWGGINAVEPPYVVVVLNAANLPKDAREEIEFLRGALIKA